MLAASRKCSGVVTNLILVTFLLTASMCLGQSRRGDVIANVPFPFVVADHSLPPGRYIVTPIGETNLRIYAKKQGFIFQTHSVTGRRFSSSTPRKSPYCGIPARYPIEFGRVMPILREGAGTCPDRQVGVSNSRPVIVPLASVAVFWVPPESRKWLKR
jgi:hypothetical protein